MESMFFTNSINLNCSYVCFLNQPVLIPKT